MNNDGRLRFKSPSTTSTPLSVTLTTSFTTSTCTPHDYLLLPTMQTFARALRISRFSLGLPPASKRNLLVLPAQSAAVKCRSTQTRSFTCSARALDNSHNHNQSTQTDTTSVSKQNVDKASSGAEQSRYHVLNEESPYSAPPSQNPQSSSSSQTDTTSVSKSDVDTANEVASQTPPYSSQTQPQTQKTQTQTLTQPDEPRLSLTFTCTVPQCETRSTHEFTKRSYERGIVIVQCPGCKNR